MRAKDIGMSSWRIRVSNVSIVALFLAPAYGCGGTPSTGLGGGAPPAGGSDGSVNDASAVWNVAPDAATAFGAGSNPDGGAGPLPCSPAGSTRACCNNGTQTCGGTEFHTWGPCLDGTGAPAVCAPSPGCDGGEGRTGCDAGADGPSPSPKPLPKKGCGLGMECIPGSTRYCDDARFPAWSRSECNTTGRWGSCHESPGVQGCDQTQYDPVACCQPRFLCCQYEVNGPFVDYGGSCSALSCMPLDGGTD